MNFKIINFCMLIVAVITVDTQAQNVSESLNEISDYYQNNDYNINIEYKMFKGYEGSIATESYKGNIYKSENLTKIDILDSEIFVFKTARLTILSNKNTITYNNLEQNGPIKESPLNISDFLNYYELTSTKEQGDIIIHDLQLKSTGYPFPYNRVVMHSNKNTHQLVKQVLYFSTKMPFKESDGSSSLDSARMEILFRNNPKSMATEPVLGDFLSINSTHSPKLLGKYADFNLIDQTNI